MMLMDGQLSHIGFEVEVRCLLLSALLAVDEEADDEDMRELTCNKMKMQRGGPRRGVRMPE